LQLNYAGIRDGDYLAEVKPDGSCRSSTIEWLTKGEPTAVLKAAGKISEEQSLKDVLAEGKGNLLDYMAIVDIYLLRFPITIDKKRVNPKKYFELIMPNQAHRDLYWILRKVRIGIHPLHHSCSIQSDCGSLSFTRSAWGSPSLRYTILVEKGCFCWSVETTLRGSTRKCLQL
jgi:hypothetical protein